MTRMIALLVIAAVGSMGSFAQDSIKAQTPAPSRDGVGFSANAAPTPGPNPGDMPYLPAVQGQMKTAPKGGSYSISLDEDGDPVAADDDEDTSIVANAELNSSGQAPNAQELQQKIATAKAMNQVQNVPPDATSQAIMNAIAQQQASNRRLEASIKKSSSDGAGGTGNKRDATKTDAVVDAEFAEASASRRASSIARAKGFSLVPALRTIRMRMLTATSSEQGGGKSKAVVLDDVWDATYSSIAIPSGSLARLFVEGATGDTDTRIRLTITEFQLPGGDAIQLRIPDAATDAIGASGPEAEVDHRYGTRFLGAAGTAIIGALASSGTTASTAMNATFNDALRNNLSGQLGSSAQGQFQTGLSAKPIMSLHEGTVIHMTLGTNLYLVPWKSVRPIMPVPSLLLTKRSVNSDVK